MRIREFKKSDLGKMKIREHDSIGNLDTIIKQVERGLALTFEAEGQPLFVLGFEKIDRGTVLWALSDPSIKRHAREFWKKYRLLEDWIGETWPAPYWCTVDPERPEAIDFIERIFFKPTGNVVDGQIVYRRG